MTKPTSLPDPIDIEDCHQVYADHDLFEPCDKSPTGQCQYSWRDKWTNCMHCGGERGLC